MHICQLEGELMTWLNASRITKIYAFLKNGFWTWSDKKPKRPNLYPKTFQHKHSYHHMNHGHTVIQ